MTGPDEMGADMGAEAAGFEDEGKAWRQHEPAGPAGDFFAGPPQQEWLDAGAGAAHNGGANDARNASATANPNVLRTIDTL